MEDSSKKSKVLDTAMELFRKKGFSSASMQDIAEACGMAKASIYKLFPSKEDLFTAAFVACHQTMLEMAAELDRTGMPPGLPAKERLSRKVEFYLYYVTENHVFMIDFRELPITDNDHFKEARRRKKTALLTWRREMLLEVYGERLEPYIWDAVMMFRGILHEYMTFVIQKVIALPMKELADYIVDRMDAVVEDLIRSAPRAVIGESIVYFNDVNRSDEAARRQTVSDFLGAMEARIATLPVPDAARTELTEVVGLVRQEFAAASPNLTLLRVLKSYLEAVPELRPYLRQLKLLVK